MGLLNARNLSKAKQMLEKNRDKVGDMVEKAGGQLDKVSKGKTSNLTSKAAEAARNYSEGGVSHHHVDTHPGHQTGYNSEQAASDARIREAQATTGAANAVKGAADALTNMMNKAAQTAEAHNAQQGSVPKPDGSSDASTGDA